MRETLHPGCWGTASLTFIVGSIPNECRAQKVEGLLFFFGVFLNFCGSFGDDDDDDDDKIVILAALIIKFQ